ncbi:MAG: sugar kinase, partial [Acidimicrobiales bacterium]
ARRCVPVSVDPSSVTYLRALGPETFLEMTARCDFLFPNAAEARLLSGAHDDVAAASALAESYRTVVV